ncbi:MAG: chemotaxis protein CheW [Myxococcales bacterium]|jgi:chemotaxis signal transduction protein
MQGEKPPAKAQRLALIFRGASTRWALPASSVLEVAPPPEPGQQGTATRRGLVTEDFSELLGERSERGPGAVTLVLDHAPPRALLVDAVEGVADLAPAPFFLLPAAIQAPAGALIRGAVLLGSGLVLEIDPQQLAELQPRPPAQPALAGLREAEPAEPPARALVFEAGDGELVGTALSLVTGVLRVAGLCRVPRAPLGHLGLLHHERSLLPIYDLALLSGRTPTGGDLAVALDVGSSAVAVAARRVLGVVEGFADLDEGAPGGRVYAARDGRRIFFPAWEAWFPGAG